jgi:AraC-like DNA-binding protein
MSDSSKSSGREGVIHFSTADFPERDRLDRFLETYGRAIIKHDIEPAADHPFYFEATLYGLPGLGMASATISPCDAPRTARHIDGDDLVFNVSLTGGRSLRQRGRDATVGAGEAVVTTSAEPGIVSIPVSSRTLSFRIPLDRIRPLIADFDACLLRPIRRETPALRLLTSYAGEVVRSGALTVPGMRGQVVAHLHDLIAMTIGATRDAAAVALGRGVGAARLRVIKADIVGKLCHADLTIEAVAARHGISSRYVRALFGADGTTFGEYVIGRRLALAHRRLSDPHDVGRTISAIAFACGFGDLSYFNRVFRRQYGMTPSDVRETARLKRHD